MAEHEDIEVHEETPEERKRTTIWLIVALVGAVLAGVLLASSVWTGEWKSKGNIVGNELVENKPGIDPQSWCAAQATYDAIRRELFRRAAQVRGGDSQAYTRISDFSLLRMNGPVVRGIDDRLHSVSCSGTAVLDLPPDVTVSGGRRSLSGDVDYMIQPAADGTGNVIRIGNADSIVIPLATLSRIGAPQSAPLVPPEFGNATAPTAGEETSTETVEEPATEESQGDLDALRQQVAAQFSSALAQADDDQRRLLERTDRRFRSFRDRCATDQCVEQTYRSRMREISDIMADRWRG
jgi:hypothetical protein